MHPHSNIHPAVVAQCTGAKWKFYVVPRCSCRLILPERLRRWVIDKLQLFLHPHRTKLRTRKTGICIVLDFKR